MSLLCRLIEGTAHRKNKRGRALLSECPAHLLLIIPGGMSVWIYFIAALIMPKDCDC